MARSKKSLKKIQGLIFLMLITLIFGITATYAWFSTQRDVEIAGMRLNVEVSESLQISLDGEKWTQSIQIADMRQFYGTYNVSGDEGFAVFQAKEGNENYVPTELVPVSTAGEVAGGKLQFVQGTIGTNSDGTQSLTGITACTETDITNTATIATKEGNNDKHPYLVFDMYLRNISAKTEGIDELILNKDSSVYIDERPMMREQEGAGKKGTGLEYSARVGMIVYGNTVSVTAEDDATLGTVGEQIRGITHNNSEVAAIWEPNYLEHTQYVVNNNGRGITNVSQAVTTYGIKSAVASTTEKTVPNVNAGTDSNSDGIEDTNSNLVAVNTFKPEYETTTLIDEMFFLGYRTSVLGVKNGTVITNTEGNSIGLAPNQISKVRVYIWLEGQDPDCIDMASTGDRLNVNLKLTKETNTTVENSYHKEFTGKAPVEKGNTITAATLVGYERTEYGAYVTNFESINETTNGASLDWRIFHTDGDNIYLITDDYIEEQYVPAGKGGATIDSGVTYNPNDKTYMLVGAYANYSGLTDISGALANKLLSESVVAGITNSGESGKATAYLLDTIVWSNFKDSTGYADYAIGGPTIELFVASYNKIYYTDIHTKATGLGYQVKWSNDAEYSEFSIGGLDTNNTLYVNEKGLWLASPPHKTTGSLITVKDTGYIRRDTLVDSSGCRPIICLNTDVELQKQADGTYKIVE